ncbi:MAG: hypothetical protein E7535_04640 [Ruminococcaceae bacterium]|nr:hypothetical protein [Oscillospiraceae bacterium]
MKKILAVLMAALVVFTTCSIAVFAEEEDVETTVAATVKEESTTRNILNDEGLVVPINLNQLKSSVIFKIFEKIIKFILSLFGSDVAPEVDQEGATLVDEIGSALDERLTDIFA